MTYDDTKKGHAPTCQDGNEYAVNQKTVAAQRLR